MKKLSQNGENAEAKHQPGVVERVQGRSIWRGVPDKKGGKGNRGRVSYLKKGIAVKSIGTYIVRT